jgi:hypothetical protein
MYGPYYWQLGELLSWIQALEFHLEKWFICLVD